MQKKANNSFDPKIMSDRETNVKQGRDKEVDLFVRVQKEIYEATMNAIDWIMKESSNYIINPYYQVQKLSRFDTNTYFQEYVLPYKYNYQQYLCKEPRFQGYIQLSIGKEREIYFKIMLYK